MVWKYQQPETFFVINDESQGGVAMNVRCGEMFNNDFIANLVP